MLGKRRARVVREELREGSGLFAILAHLPAQASFGLADDLRARTSGGASAALMLSHWERLQVSFLAFTPCSASAGFSSCLQKPCNASAGQAWLSHDPAS